MTAPVLRDILNMESNLNTWQLYQQTGRALQRFLQKRVEQSSNTWPYPKTIPLLLISRIIEEVKPG